METKQEHWVEETLSSASLKSQVPISERLKQRLEAIPSEVTVASVVIPMRAVYLAAAGLALLITVNMLSVKEHKKSENEKTTLYTEYFSYLEQL